MSVRPKTKANVVAVTCCDMGRAGCRKVLGEHYTYAAACRAYQKHWEFHHKTPASQGVKPLVRVWIEYVQPEGGGMADGTGQLRVDENGDQIS